MGCYKENWIISCWESTQGPWFELPEVWYYIKTTRLPPAPEQAVLNAYLTATASFLPLNIKHVNWDTL